MQSPSPPFLRARHAYAPGFDSANVASDFRRASGADKASIAAKMEAAWELGKKDVQSKLEEYRRLHVELKRIKQAVNRYVAANP